VAEEGSQQADQVTQVALVDPNVLFRCGIARLLDALHDFKVVVESNDVSEAIRLAQAQQPDVMLLDIELAGVDAPNLTRRIARELPHVKIVLLSDQVDPDTLLGCVLAGAAGFLLKRITRAASTTS
jgi:DNA-binding NarL/FixJ family response regulator